MGRETRPIYVCDKCNSEFLDPKQVRTFVGNVTDGEKTLYVGDNIVKKEKDTPLKTDSELKINLAKIAIYSNMYCLECIPEILNLDNKTFEYEEVSGEDIIDESEEIEKEDENIVDSLDDEVKFKVYGQIKTIEQESYVAEQYEFENVQALRESYGGPLTGLYIDTGQRVSNIPQDVNISQIQIIDGVLFGIPNVKDIEAFISEDKTYAFIEIEENGEEKTKECSNEETE